MFMFCLGFSKRRRLGYGQAGRLFVFSGVADAQPNGDQARGRKKRKKKKEKRFTSS